MKVNTNEDDDDRERFARNHENNRFDDDDDDDDIFVKEGYQGYASLLGEEEEERDEMKVKDKSKSSKRSKTKKSVAAADDNNERKGEKAGSSIDGTETAQTVPMDVSSHTHDDDGGNNNNPNETAAVTNGAEGTNHTNGDDLDYSIRVKARHDMEDFESFLNDVSPASPIPTTLTSNGKKKMTVLPETDSSNNIVENFLQGLAASVDDTSGTDEDSKKEKEVGSKKKEAIMKTLHADAAVSSSERSKDSTGNRLGKSTGAGPAVSPNPQSSLEMMLQSKPKRSYVSATLQFAKKFISEVEVKDRKQTFKTYRKCFVGKDVVDWMVTSKYARTRLDGVKLGRELQGRGLFKHVKGGHPLFDDDKNMFYVYLDLKQFVPADPDPNDDPIDDGEEEEPLKPISSSLSRRGRQRRVRSKERKPNGCDTSSDEDDDDDASVASIRSTKSSIGLDGDYARTKRRGKKTKKTKQERQARRCRSLSPQNGSRPLKQVHDESTRLPKGRNPRRRSSRDYGDDGSVASGQSRENSVVSRDSSCRPPRSSTKQPRRSQSDDVTAYFVTTSGGSDVDEDTHSTSPSVKKSNPKPISRRISDTSLTSSGRRKSGTTAIPTTATKKLKKKSSFDGLSISEHVSSSSSSNMKNASWDIVGTSKVKKSTNMSISSRSNSDTGLLGRLKTKDGLSASEHISSTKSSTKNATWGKPADGKAQKKKGKSLLAPPQSSSSGSALRLSSKLCVEDDETLFMKKATSTINRRSSDTNLLSSAREVSLTRTKKKKTDVLSRSEHGSNSTLDSSRRNSDTKLKRIKKKDGLATSEHGSTSRTTVSKIATINKTKKQQKCGSSVTSSDEIHSKSTSYKKKCGNEIDSLVDILPKPSKKSSTRYNLKITGFPVGSWIRYQPFIGGVFEKEVNKKEYALFFMNHKNQNRIESELRSLSIQAPPDDSKNSQFSLTVTVLDMASIVSTYQLFVNGLYNENNKPAMALMVDPAASHNEISIASCHSSGDDSIHLNDVTKQELTATWQSDEINNLSKDELDCIELANLAFGGQDDEPEEGAVTLVPLGGGDDPPGTKNDEERRDSGERRGRRRTHNQIRDHDGLQKTKNSEDKTKMKRSLSSVDLTNSRDNPKKDSARKRSASSVDLSRDERGRSRNREVDLTARASSVNLKKENEAKRSSSAHLAPGGRGRSKCRREDLDSSSARGTKKNGRTKEDSSNIDLSRSQTSRNGNDGLKRSLSAVNLFGGDQEGRRRNRSMSVGGFRPFRRRGSLSDLGKNRDASGQKNESGTANAEIDEHEFDDYFSTLIKPSGESPEEALGLSVSSENDWGDAASYAYDDPLGDSRRSECLSPAYETLKAKKQKQNLALFKLDQAISDVTSKFSAELLAISLDQSSQDGNPVVSGTGSRKKRGKDDLSKSCHNPRSGKVTKERKPKRSNSLCGDNDERKLTRSVSEKNLRSTTKGHAPKRPSRTLSDGGSVSSQVRLRRNSRKKDKDGMSRSCHSTESRERSIRRRSSKSVGDDISVASTISLRRNSSKKLKKDEPKGGKAKSSRSEIFASVKNQSIRSSKCDADIDSVSSMNSRRSGKKKAKGEDDQSAESTSDLPKPRRGKKKKSSKTSEDTVKTGDRPIEMLYVYLDGEDDTTPAKIKSRTTKTTQNTALRSKADSSKATSSGTVDAKLLEEIDEIEKLLHEERYQLEQDKRRMKNERDELELQLNEEMEKNEALQSIIDNGCAASASQNNSNYSGISGLSVEDSVLRDNDDAKMNALFELSGENEGLRAQIETEKEDTAETAAKLKKEIRGLKKSLKQMANTDESMREILLGILGSELNETNMKMAEIDTSVQIEESLIRALTMELEGYRNNSDTGHLEKELDELKKIDSKREVEIEKEKKELDMKMKSRERIESCLCNQIPEEVKKEQQQQEQEQRPGLGGRTLSMLSKMRSSFSLKMTG